MLAFEVMPSLFRSSLRTRLHAPPASRVRAPARSSVCATAAAPRIPATYEQLYARASAAAAAAIGPGSGLRAVEIEFPPTPSLARAGTGSRAADDAARASNARLAAAVARAIAGSVSDITNGGSGGAAVAVVAFDGLMRRAVEEEVRGTGVEVVSSQAVQGNGMVDEASVLVGASPAAIEEWVWLENESKDGRTVVVCNGLFYNGSVPFEPVFYVKPCTGWGVVMLEFPNRVYQAVSGRTGNVLQDVEELQQGKIRRPDLQTASAVLMKDFYATS